MAEHNEVAYTTADGMDYPAHEQTYEGFLVMTKYGTLAVIAILALMAIFSPLIEFGCSPAELSVVKSCAAEWLREAS